MGCLGNSRAWHLVIVSFWFLITVIRQILDSIGRLWIPVIFNTFQIFSCICGIIAVIHWQKRLLAVFILLNLTSILYNITLILWYSEYFSVDRDTPVLSAGFSHSYSFFLRYTPSCKSYYNFTSLRWIQLSCIIPYYHIEVAQALFHIFMANISIILSTILLPKQNFKKSQGCSNETFDLTDRETIKQSTRPINGYVRNSAKKSARKSYKEAIITAHQNSDNFQKNESVVKRSQSMINLVNHAEQIHRQNNERTTDNESMQIAKARNIESGVKSGSVHRTGSLKNFKMPTTEGVRRILSLEEINFVSNFQTNDYSATSPSNNLKSLVSFDPKSNVLLRIQNHIDDDYNISDIDDKFRQMSAIQKHRQSKMLSNQVLFPGTIEQVPHPHRELLLRCDSSISCQQNELIKGLCNKNASRYYNLDSFNRNHNETLSNYLWRQPIYYPKCKNDITYDTKNHRNLEESELLPSIIHHSESSILSRIPIFNSNGYLV